MADLMTDSFRRTKMIQLNHLEPQARIQCPCVLVNRLCVRHARCGCVFCVHIPSDCRYCVGEVRAVQVVLRVVDW